MTKLIKKKRVTIKDIAKRMNVSAMTVANALMERRSEVSESLAVKIRKKAASMGYVKNQNASSLVNKRSNMLVLVIVNAYNPLSDAHETDFINPFYGELIVRLENECRTAGFRLCVYGAAGGDFVDYVMEQNATAAILVGSAHPDLAEKIVRQGTPVILFDYPRKSRYCSRIRTDEIQGGYLAAEHLITQRKCKCVAYLGDIKKPAGSVSRQRLCGVRRACAEFDVPLREINRTARFDDGRKAAEEIANLKVDGVVAAADHLAAGLIAGLRELGIRVPEDIAVTGYDNLFPASIAYPALTSIDQGLKEKVRAVIRMIKLDKPGQQVTIRPQLVVRGSA